MANVDTHETTASNSGRRGADEDVGYREGAKDVAREAQEKAERVKDEVVEQSVEARHELEDQADSLFRELLNAVADQIDRLGQVLRRTEEELHEEQLDELAGYPAQLANGIDEVNDYLREGSAKTFRRDDESPVLVIGGLAAAGGLLAWYLRRGPQGGEDGRSAASTSENRSRERA